MPPELSTAGLSMTDHTGKTTFPEDRTPPPKDERVMGKYIFSTEYFDGHTVRTVIDGSFTPPAIFFEELTGRDRLGEPTWREFHPSSPGWNMFATCLIKSALRGGAKGGHCVNSNGEAKRHRRPNGEPLRILRDLYSSAPDVALTLCEIVKQTGIFRSSVFFDPQ